MYSISSINILNKFHNFVTPIRTHRSSYNTKVIFIKSRSPVPEKFLINSKLQKFDILSAWNAIKNFIRKYFLPSRVLVSFTPRSFYTFIKYFAVANKLSSKLIFIYSLYVPTVSYATRYVICSVRERQGLRTIKPHENIHRAWGLFIARYAI